MDPDLTSASYQLTVRRQCAALAPWHPGRRMLTLALAAPPRLEPLPVAFTRQQPLLTIFTMPASDAPKDRLVMLPAGRPETEFALLYINSAIDHMSLLWPKGNACFLPLTGQQKQYPKWWTTLAAVKQCHYWEHGCHRHNVALRRSWRRNPKQLQIFQHLEIFPILGVVDHHPIICDDMFQLW